MGRCRILSFFNQSNLDSIVGQNTTLLVEQSESATSNIPNSSCRKSINEVANSPQNIGTIQDADLIGQSGKRGGGPFMVLYLKLDGDIISNATCQTYGCPAAIACASELAGYIKGKALKQVEGLEPKDIRGWFKDFPIGKNHCSNIAAKALEEALKKNVNGNFQIKD